MHRPCTYNKFTLFVKSRARSHRCVGLSQFTFTYKRKARCLLLHDVTFAVLVSPNNETAAMFESSINPVGIDFFFFNVKTFFAHERCWSPWIMFMN